MKRLARLGAYRASLIETGFPGVRSAKEPLNTGNRKGFPMATASITAQTHGSKFHGRAQECADAILAAFESPSQLPKALAPIFINRKDDTPCRKWSFSNQLLAVIFGAGDARGFRQWQEVSRHVVKGGRGFPILVPIKRTFTKTDANGEEKRVSIVRGFTSTIVFGIDQTDGAPLPPPDPAVLAWIDALPFVDVARTWGLNVDAYNGKGARGYGYYSPRREIGLGVQNLSTWAHELIHAADDRLGNLQERGQHWRSEIVAELGGAILLTIAGQENGADLGGCWNYVNAYAKDSEKDTASACVSVLNRTCQAVALVLDTAEALQLGSEVSA